MPKPVQIKKYILLICTMLFLSWSLTASASLLDKLQRLKQAYPDFIQATNEQYITWTDGTKMPIQDGKPDKSAEEKLNSPSLADQLEQSSYPAGLVTNRSTFNPATDPGRIRYEAFFRKMYGQSATQVKKKLTTVYWLTKLFGKQYPLHVTTVNGVDKKIIRISEELEQLVAIHPEFRRYLENPGGFFNWRNIFNTQRLSAHSYGIALDINIKYSNYWKWELEKKGMPVSESTPLVYVNHIPWEIVLIFEKYGFIWGGKWHHFDTMHFEYRPELFSHL